jgi:hypothetical protein
MADGAFRYQDLLSLPIRWLSLRETLFFRITWHARASIAWGERHRHAHKRRMDRIADQFAGPLRQFFASSAGTANVMFSSCRTQPAQYCGVMINRGRSDKLAPPRCQSVPFAIASGHGSPNREVTDLVKWLFATLTGPSGPATIFHRSNRAPATLSQLPGRSGAPASGPRPRAGVLRGSPP